MMLRSPRSEMLAACSVITASLLIISAVGQGGERPPVAQAGNEQPVELPVFMRREMIQASLDALRNNGVLAQLDALGPQASVPVKHVVSGETRVACRLAVAWGERNGLRGSEVVVSYGHGGVEQYSVELKHEVPAQVEPLRASMAEVLDGMADCPGARYVTWMVDFPAPQTGRSR